MKENNLFRDVVVVADDFTGANDAGVSLALSGKKVSVAFHTPLPSRWMHWLLIPIPVRCGQQRRPKKWPYWERILRLRAGSSKD